VWSIPVFCWFFITLFLMRKGCELRAAFILAAIIWGCLVTLFTECLGYFHLLTAGGLVLCWGAATTVVLLSNFKLKKQWRTWGGYPFSALESGLIGGVALICLATFLTAIISPPNNWDSMIYHMSRVLHWLQNRSVDHYPTHILRQIEMNPWAEFAITTFQSLSGGDRFANLVQWFSMMGSLVGTSLIAAQLGGNRRSQLFAAVVTATVPMGILQASSTQNDYVVAFWLVCLAWAGLHFMKQRELKWAGVIGAAIGLAVLSKGTAYFYAFPFIVWFTAFAVRRLAPRQVAFSALCIVVPFILLNAPHYQRNYKVFSNPLTSGEDSYTIENISAGTLFSNLLRNTAMQLSSPSDNLNKWIGEGVEKLHECLHIDLNDPKTTWADMKFSIVGGNLMRNEDYSGNFLHVLLAFSVLLTLIIGASFRKVEAAVLFYTCAVAAGFLLYCLVLKWQPWGNRLMLPLLVLGAPVTGVVVGKCWKSELVICTALALLMAALPWAFSNSTRPLVHVSGRSGVTFPLLTVDRNLLYFASNRRQGVNLYKQYVNIARDIRQKKATRIGLVLSGGSWEYPLWMLIKQWNPAVVRIEQVEVGNQSRFAGTSDFKPDYYVRLD